MNTRFIYLYRDGSNYKSWGEVVFAGAPSDDTLGRVLAALDRSEFFIADQIRVPEKFFENWPRYDDDHCWHEFSSLEETKQLPTDEHSRAIADFVDEIEAAAKSAWKVFDPAERVRATTTEPTVIRDASRAQPEFHSDAEIMGGQPVFIGTRVPVRNLFEHLEAGDPLEKFLHSFPSVSREQALAALEVAREALERIAYSHR